jgi:hypothetical protein
MRRLTVLFGTLIAIAAVSATIWSARYAPWVHQQPVAENPVVGRLRAMKEGADRQAGRKPETSGAEASRMDPAVESRPLVADKPPFPKAVIAERVFAFGRMGTDEQRKHVFRIENKGEAPLVIAKGPTECKCTLSTLANHQVPPGASTEIEVEWTARAPDRLFDKTAIIWTNDPASPEIHLEVAGRVVPPLEVVPRAWNASTVTNDEDGIARGEVLSETKEFKIVAIEPADPNIKIKFQPLAPGELKRRNLPAGYDVTVTVGKNLRLGHFRSRLKIITSLSGKQAVEVELAGQRSGPIRFLPAVALVGVARWNADKLLLNMGRFDHATGAKTALPALVYSMKDDFHLVGVQTSDKFVKVSVEPMGGGEKQGREHDQQQVRFIFEVPPGSPPVNYLTGKPVHVTVTTNHPHLQDLDFDLSFVSR